jgi:hypothetical protein
MYGLRDQERAHSTPGSLAILSSLVKPLLIGRNVK